MELTPENLVFAYSSGYFPMPDPQSGEIMWLRPDPRTILPLDGFRTSHSLRRSLKKFPQITRNKAFFDTMRACADRPDTWITDEFLASYNKMHQLGFADSIEVWKNGSLVGGVYGVRLRRAFFAESMFHTETDASKVALFHLVRHLNENGFILLEVQFMTPHLKSLGAIEIADADYIKLLARALE